MRADRRADAAPSLPATPTRPIGQRIPRERDGRPVDDHTDAVTAMRFVVVGEDDGASLERLAALAQAAPPDGPMMLAELDGEPVAAVAMANGDVIADRSRAGAAIIALLQLHRLEARVIGSIWGV